MIELLLLAVALTVLAGFLAGRVRSWSRRRALLDVPNARSLHRRPVPTGGGLVMVGLCLIGLTVAAACGLIRLDRPLAGYLAAGAIIAAIGWADDLRPLSSRLRLVVQVLAAGIFLAAGPCLIRVELPWLGLCRLEHWGLAVALVWLVGLTNAYNFMDGLDGLAATQAVSAAAGWLLLAGLAGQPSLAVLALLVLCGAAGFLTHNWPPARLFMGDVGSTFLGFTFAAMGVLATAHEPRLAPAAVLLVWPFVFDAAVTFLRRFVRGENVFTPHRTHLYQRLATAGWPARRVVLLYGGLALVGLLSAVASVEQPGLGRLVVLVVPTLACALWWLVRSREALAASQSKPPSAEMPTEDSACDRPFSVRIRRVGRQPEHVPENAGARAGDGR